MQKELEKSIQANAEKAAKATSPDEACKYSQAALNAAHALAIIKNQTP